MPRKLHLSPAARMFLHDARKVLSELLRDAREVILTYFI